jgi:hypothetical protein
MEASMPTTQPCQSGFQKSKSLSSYLKECALKTGLKAVLHLLIFLTTFEPVWQREIHVQ